MHKASITKQTGLTSYRSSGQGSILVHTNIRQSPPGTRKSLRKQQNKEKPKGNKKKKGKKLKIDQIQMPFKRTLDYDKIGKLEEINLFSPQDDELAKTDRIDRANLL